MSTPSIQTIMEDIAIRQEFTGYTICNKAARAIALAHRVRIIGRFVARQHAVKFGILNEYRIARQLLAANSIAI